MASTALSIPLQSAIKPFFIDQTSSFVYPFTSIVQKAMPQIAMPVILIGCKLFSIFSCASRPVSWWM